MKLEPWGNSAIRNWSVLQKFLAVKLVVISVFMLSHCSLHAI